VFAIQFYTRLTFAALLQINFLTSVGLKQDEICNMASISVVLLGLNPETRLKTVTDYLKSRGVSDGSVADLVLRHPRIFEYKVGDVHSAHRHTLHFTYAGVGREHTTSVILHAWLSLWVRAAGPWWRRLVVGHAVDGC
jgi:hypothetical protein